LIKTTKTFFKNV